MALDVVKLYISLISEFFKLSDMAVMTSSNSTASTLPLIPSDSHSLATAYYLSKILGELQESVGELNGMDISSEASSSLKSLHESAKWRFTDILINAWLRGELTLLFLSVGANTWKMLTCSTTSRPG
jgi:exocyst complex component 2